MSLKKFFKNICYLSKYDLKEMNVIISEMLPDNEMIEQVMYECASSKIQRPKIKSYEDTIKDIIKNNASISRFGDGEFLITEGKDIPFQKYDKKLADRLKQIIKEDKENLYIGINNQYYYPDLQNFTNICKIFYRTYVPKIRNKFSSLLNWEKQYYSAAFTQLYQTLNEYPFENIYNLVRKIWDNKKILIVCGNNIFDKIDYNIYDNASQLNYLYIPAKNAFDIYDEILNKIEKVSKDTMIILIAGPTASVLAYDLYNRGYQALDMGHLSKDYDYYKKSVSRTDENIKNFMKPD